MTHYGTQADMAKAYGVKRQAVTGWLKNEANPFPAKDRFGWKIEQVAAWIEAMNERKDSRSALSGDREEKTRLECARLRVVIERERELLAQTKLETAKRSGLLHSVAECEREWDRVGAELRAAVDSWQQHATAKQPKARALIDGLVNGFLARLEAVR